MSCCKKKRADKKAVGASKDTSSERNIEKSAQSMAKSAPVSKTPKTSSPNIGGYHLGELALAAGALILLPIALRKIAPKSLESVKDFFDIASRTARH